MVVYTDQHMITLTPEKDNTKTQTANHVRKNAVRDVHMVPQRVSDANGASTENKDLLFDTCLVDNASQRVNVEREREREQPNV